MAAAASLCCSRMRLLRVSAAPIRFHKLALSGGAHPKTEVPVESGADGHSRKQKKRDDLAVLRALASTVQASSMSPPKALIEDVFLLPRSRDLQKECKLARESGNNAAQFVIDKYPELFPIRPPQPSWPPPKTEVVSDLIESEEDLKMLCERREVKKAIKGFEKLKSNGISVSLDTQNDLLDLVGQALGTVSAEESLKDEQVDTSEIQESEEILMPEEEESFEEDDIRMKKQRFESMWRKDNYAEMMFNKMETKNARSYEIFILALVKYENFNKAFEIFDEMRQNGFQATVFTYNTLLNFIPKHQVLSSYRWSAAQKLISSMNSEPVVRPNLLTYNSVLQLCKDIEDGSGTDTAIGIIRDMPDSGIEPSLATFNHLLRAEYMKYHLKKQENIMKRIKPKEPAASSKLLHDVVSHLETFDKLPIIQDPNDVRFFNTAMGAALLCEGTRLAMRIYHLSTQNSSNLLGQTRSPFYGNLLLTFVRGENNAEYVYSLYEELVPSDEDIVLRNYHSRSSEKFVPREWVYKEIFWMLDKAKLPRLVPKLYEDMKKYRVFISEGVANAIFGALTRRTEIRYQKRYLEVMLDVLHWMKTYDIPISHFVLGSLVRMYCLGGQIKSAWKVLDMFEEYNLTPNFTAMGYLLECAKLKKDKERAIKALEVMSKLGFHLNQKRRSDVFEFARFTLEERQYINGLFEDMSALDRRRDNVRLEHQRESDENFHENERTRAD